MSARTETASTERISSVPQEVATELAPRARPSPVQTAAVSTAAGVLATPDGAVYQLDRSYVIGRAPLTDEEVRNATASPIVLQYDPYCRGCTPTSRSTGWGLHPRRVDQRGHIHRCAGRHGMDPNRHNAREARSRLEHAGRRMGRDSPRRRIVQRAGEGSAVNALQSPARSAARASGLTRSFLGTAPLAAATSAGW